MLDRFRLVRRFRALVRADPAGIRSGFVALLISSVGDLVAGLTLGSITGTLIHSVSFRLSRRRDTLVGQNLAAAIALSLSISLVLAVLAKAISVGFGLEHTISIVDFMVISVVGGFLSSIVVLVITVLVASMSTRRGWDLDNVSAPIVTAAGDMVTLPSLFLATYLVGYSFLTPLLAIACAVAGVAALAVALYSRYPIL